MKKFIYRIKLLSVATLAGLTISSCSLDEYNPGGFTMETVASTEEGFESLVNQCYFAMERYFYGSDNWIYLSEADSDLWTYTGNESTSYTEWFWYFAGASPNTTFTNSWWNGTYDGIGSCNTVLAYAHLAPFNETKLNWYLAQARFMRALYYHNAVEMFGGITVITDLATSIDFEPERVDPLTIYEEIIIPDLEFAFEWLEVGTHDLNTIPTKKSALGFLVRACLSTVQYDSSKQYASKALDYAKMLIEDAESGGSRYNAVMYNTYEEVFAEENNWANQEALWKHRWYAGPDGHGSSNGNYRTNRLNEFFYCNVYRFGALQDTQEHRITWGGNQAGTMMPTQHLISLFDNGDGSLDPRFHKSFQTEWNANAEYTWGLDAANRFDKSPAVVGKTIDIGDKAVKFLMPQDAGYATEAANRSTSDYLVIDYSDVYNNAKKNVNMLYSYRNPSEGYPADGTAENQFRYFYPSLTKYNTSNFYVVNAGSQRNANLSAVLIMRMAEVYLLAAEADIYVNGGANAMGYINKIRNRAGAEPLSGTATLRTVLDERARELCGENVRFLDLKRMGMLDSDVYFKETHPDMAQYFLPVYKLKPISTTFTATLKDGGAYYQNPGY